ncbi:MAG: hypothetical protein KME45_15195 [Stenomitos rutilans HA7619-LM2]|nr:hypothetical protein [Stenomitos rutilans HA7619-LM2]
MQRRDRIAASSAELLLLFPELTIGKRLRSIALVTLAATRLSSIAQTNPVDDAIEPKSGSMVCVKRHHNADYSGFHLN